MGHDPGSISSTEQGERPLVTKATTLAKLGNGGPDIVRAFINDCNLAHNGTNIGSAAAGGGSNLVPVYWDPTAKIWKIG